MHHGGALVCAQDKSEEGVKLIKTVGLCYTVQSLFLCTLFFVEDIVETAAHKKFRLSAAALKWIAVVTMVIDHFGLAVYRQLPGYDHDVYFILRKIGRIAFPIYCFLLVEGFFHTKDVRKYLGRCFLFAVISEIPFDMAVFGRIIYLQGQNVFFTLCIGLCALSIIDKFKYRHEMRYILLKASVIVLAACAGEVFDVDYHWKGVMFIIMFYCVRDMREWIRNLAGICAFAYELTAPLAFIPIHFYNGERGRQAKYLFYAIYPAHLLMLGVIRLWLNGNLKF